jgi:type II secretory pathway pseudopilin PulG
MSHSSHPQDRTGEEGYLLVGAIVAIFLMLLVLSVAAPRVAKELQRDREVEAAHRANQYVVAIRRYYLKFGHYPGSIDQLKSSNNMKFLRQEYADPFTGKPDWRLIHVGEQQTTVKGLFGQPLPGPPAASLGSASGMSSNGFGASGTSGSSTSAFGSNTSPTGSGGTPAPGTGPNAAAGSSATTTGGSSSPGGISSQSATSFQGGGPPIMGVGINHSGESILVVNEQTTYNTWEFLYDPRIEQLKAKSSLLGGGPPSTGVGGLGTATGATGNGLNGPGPSGSTNSSGGGFGQSSSSFGTSGSGSSGPGNGTTPP